MNEAADNRDPVVHANDEIPRARAVPGAMTTGAGDSADRLRGPTAVTRRIEVLDALRGFALLGILLVNIQGFAFSLADTARWNPPWQGSSGDYVDFLVRLLASNKFWALFSFLFGYGFALQLARFSERGSPFAGTFVRRLVVLLAFGISHALLFWWGDILTLYAVLGFGLLIVRNWSDRALLALIAFIMMVNAGATMVFAVLDHRVANKADHSTIHGLSQEEFLSRWVRHATEVYGQGTFIEAIEQRRYDFEVILFNEYVAIGPRALALFLAGMLAMRAGLFTTATRSRKFWWRCALISLCVALPINFAHAVTAIGPQESPRPLPYVGVDILTHFAAPLLTFSYVAFFMFARSALWWRRWIETPLSFVGRMALTNYVLQSVIAGFIFNGWGLGLFGTVDPTTLRAIALGIFAIQIPMSYVWLRMFAFGPLEWVWRMATYLRVPPICMRLRA